MINALCSSGGALAVQIIILIVYFLLLVGVAYYCRRRARNVDDYLLGGRGMNGWMSAFSYGTAYFSAVIFVGYAGKFGWSYGLAATLIGVSNAAIGTYLAWKVLGKRTRNLTRNLDARTLSEFFQKRYESKNIKLATSLIIFIFLIPYSTSVYQGLAYLFEAIFGINFIWCIVMMAAVTALYLFFGGYLATSMSDFVQGIIMLAGVFIMIIMLLNNDKVRWGEGLGKIVEMKGWFPSFSSDSGKILDAPGFNLIIMMLLTSFGFWGLPQSIHKFYAIRDEKAIKQATVVSTAFSLIVGGGAYFVGALVVLYLTGNGVPMTAAGKVNFDALVPTMLTGALPAAMLGLILVLVLAASMSTLASLSLASSSAIAVDMYKGYVKPDAEDKKVKLLLRVMCIVFIVISAVLAILKIDVIVTMMSLSWGTLAGCFIGPYVLGLYSKKVNRAGAWASLASGILITLIMVLAFGFTEAPDGANFGTVLKTGIGRSPFIGCVAMASSVVVTYVVSLIFNKKCKPSDAVLDLIGRGEIAATPETATPETPIPEAAEEVAPAETVAAENDTSEAAEEKAAE